MKNNQRKPPSTVHLTHTRPSCKEEKGLLLLLLFWVFLFPLLLLEHRTTTPPLRYMASGVPRQRGKGAERKEKNINKKKDSGSQRLLLSVCLCIAVVVVVGASPFSFSGANDCNFRSAGTRPKTEKKGMGANWRLACPNPLSSHFECDGQTKTRGASPFVSISILLVAKLRSFKGRRFFRPERKLRIL